MSASEILDITITCNRCAQTSKAYRIVDESTRETVDTWGFVEFDDGPVCHICLDEPFIN